MPKLSNKLAVITCPDCKKVLGEVVSGGKMVCRECSTKKKVLVWGN